MIYFIVVNLFCILFAIYSNVHVAPLEVVCVNIRIYVFKWSYFCFMKLMEYHTCLDGAIVRVPKELFGVDDTIDDIFRELDFQLSQ